MSVKKGLIVGFFFGLNQFISLLVFGLMFYLGALFLEKKIIVDSVDANGQVTRTALQKMLVSLFAIILAGFQIGQSTQFMPDVTEGKMSAIQLFNILDIPAEHDQEPEPRDYSALQ